MIASISWPQSALNFFENRILQVSVCLMSGISATSDTVIRRSSWMRASSALDVVLNARCWRAPRSSYVRHTCSSGLKCFYPFINVTLIQWTLPHCAKIIQWKSACFDSFSPKKSDHGTLFKSGAMWKRSVHVYSLLFSQTDNGVLCNAWSNLSDSSYNRLQSVGCYPFRYSLNSLTASTFWYTLVVRHDRNGF